MASPVARKLRKQLTEAEQRLWSRLRYRQLDGARFRRQAPIGPYIADFFCPAAKLIVELDGGQHAERQDRDDARTQWLAERGYKVVRFWNNEIFENIEGVLLKIQEVLGASCA